VPSDAAAFYRHRAPKTGAEVDGLGMIAFPVPKSVKKPLTLIAGMRSMGDNQNGRLSIFVC
jgi:hypothetical protein